MVLPIPPEPIELKRWMRSLKETQPNDSSVNWDSSVVWAGNKLPKYLWDAWKKDLKPIGLTWQKFMRLLRYRTDVGVMWFNGTLSWEEFVKKVSALIQGPIGKDLRKDEPSVPARDLAQWQLPPIADWEKFERFCRDLWAEIWGDPEAHRNGRSGQAQAGVDVYGRLDKTGKWGGVQCKKKEAYADDSLTEDELYKIVEAAKSFQPSLSRFVVAYTGRRDARLQQGARNITEDHRARGLFKVDVWSWDDIQEVVGNYPRVAEKYFQLGTVVVHASKVDEMYRTTQAIFEQQTEQSVDIAEIKSAVVAPSDEAISRIAIQAIQVTADVSAVTQEYNAELDHVKELIDKFQPKEALEYVSQLEKRIPSDIGGLVRYRLLTNKAVAISAIGEERDAGVLFIEAHQYNPDDEKALSNRAIGHFLLGERDEAITFANQVLKRNPKSARAYEVLTYCASPDQPLDAVIEQIPKALRETEGIACAIAHQALEREDLPASTHWWEVAIKKSDKSRPDFLANLAGTLIESLTGKFEVVSGIQVNPEDRAKAERAINLLTEAINAVAHTETIKFRVQWLVNRSAAYAFLGRIDEAITDIDSALKFEPQNAGFLKQKAALFSRAQEFEKAIEILDGIAANPDVPEAALLLAVIVSETGKDEEAIRIVENSLSVDSIPAKLRAEENHLLLNIYLQRKDYENARRISSALRLADPTNILNLVLAARIEKASGDINAASRLLDEALTYVSETTPSRYLIELSEELHFSERYVEAWPILERVADIRIDNSLTHRLLYSYYRSGEFDKALAASRSVPVKKKSLFATQIEVAILEDIDDLQSAAAVCEEYLALHPDDLRMHVRRLVTLFRLGKFEQVDAFLNSPIDIQKLNLETGLQLAGLYAERGMSKRSLEVGYELRRNYYDKGNAHLKYIGLFFSREKDLDAWLAVDRVAEDTAVSIRDNAGVQKWYVIENRSDASAARGELNISDPLATKLLGKTVNDEIILSESAISQTKATIIEIKSKYVYALHDSLAIFPIRFAQVPGLERLTMRLRNGEEGSQEDIQSVLEAITRVDNRVREVEKLYLEGRITIGMFANLIGKNVIAVWSGLVGDQRRGIRYCMGTPDEREQAVSLIKNNPRIAIDITALLTCQSIQTLDLLRKIFSEILIGQSTIDLIQEAISERRGLGSKGFMTVWKEDEVFYRHEVTEEEIKRDIERLEELREWVRSNCTTAPRRAAPKLGDQRRSQLTEVIGEAFLDTILIAQDHRCPMYSDDFAIRGFASNEFGVEGFWTQALTMHALGAGHFDENEYNRLAVQLALMNFRHTSINGSVLIEAARQSEWVNKFRFSVVLNTLADPQTELRSAVIAASEFIFLLWRQLILDFQRDALIMAVLDALTQKRKKDVVLGTLDTAIKMRFRLLPLAETRVRQVMTVWRSLKL